MKVLEPETPIATIVLAPSKCRACPRLAGIAEGFYALLEIEETLVEADVADLATLACGSCASRRAKVNFIDEPHEATDETVTRVWLHLYPAGGGGNMTHPLKRPGHKEPLP